MIAERVSRHYGIERESRYALLMFRWANHVIEFLELTRKLEKIGIYEIENRMLSYKQKRQDIQKAVLSPMLFKRLKADSKLVQELEELSQHLSSFGSDDAKSHIESASMADGDFELSDREETKEE